MKRLKISPGLFYAAVPILACLLAMTGCTYDDMDVTKPDVQAQGVSVEISIPGFEAPVTRSIEDGKGEAAVSVIDILVFDRSSPAKLIEHLNVAKNEISQGTSASDYKISFTARLTTNADARTVVFIANAAEEVSAALLAKPIGSEKQEVLAELRFSTGQDADGTYKWDISEEYTPIPMYGEAPVSGISSGMKISGTKLTRMLARIDVQNQVAGNIFNLKEIYLVNYNTTGYIAPAWNTDNGVILTDADNDYPYADNKNPRLPDPSGRQSGSGNAAVYEYTQGSEAGPLLAGEIYTYEALKATGTESADATNAACLIVKGNYSGADYYYRIDFTTDKEGSLSPGDVEYMPLYRNHKYIVNIIAAEGIGYSSIDEALNSTTVLSNLKTSLWVIVLLYINDIVFDGQYYAGVKSTQTDIVWGVKRTVSPGVVSNYTGAWKAEVLDSTTITWLRFPNGKATMYGSDITNAGIEYDADALAAWVGNSNTSGQIRLSIGRLRMTLTVNRVPIAPLFARSNIVLTGDELDFAITREDNARIPAYSQGVVFKWGSLLALSPAGNPYNPSQHVIYNPSPWLDPGTWGSGLAGWDLIPYAHTNFGFPPVTIPSDDGYYAFGNYPQANPVGYDSDQGVGDICTYLSSLNDLGGTWRIPTYEDMQLLYRESEVQTAKIGGFTNKTSILNESAATYRNGTFNPESGWWFGANVDGSTSSTANMGTPPEGTVFFPISGHRYPDGDGDIVQVGSYGYYWSSTPYDQITVNYPWFSRYGLDFYDADRSYAYPIRCILSY